jgi:hypothetical protein
MKNTFSDYYKKSEEDLGRIWKNALIVLDTNVLLNLYRYPEAARADLSKMLTEISDKLWIPHQVGLEFHRNRLTVILDQFQKLRELETLQKSISTAVKEKIESFRRIHILTAPDAPLDKLSQTLENFRAEVQQLREIIEKETESEQILNNVTTLLDGKVGPPYDKEKLDSLHKKADERYKDKTPPGYKDQGKEKPRSYGDFIIWSQMMEKAKEAGQPIIFVSDDEKEDWWRKGPRIGDLFGPRAELCAEFRFETKQEFHMYTADQFMEEVKKRLSVDIKDETVQTAKDIRQAKEELVSWKEALGVAIDLPEVSRIKYDFGKIDPAGLNSLLSEAQESEIRRVVAGELKKDLQFQSLLEKLGLGRNPLKEAAKSIQLKQFIDSCKKEPIKD